MPRPMKGKQMRVSTQIRFALHMVIAAITSFMGFVAASEGDVVAAILLLGCVGLIAAVAAIQISNE